MPEQAEKVARRWFVSKFAELVITMVPADHVVIGNKEVRQRARRITFRRMIKPPKYWGTGLLGSEGSEGVDGTDRNASRYCSIFSTDDPEVLEFLRNHEYYRTSVQDNQLTKHFQPLEQLDFDPEKAYKPGEGVAVVARKEKDLDVDEQRDVPEGAPA